MATGDTYLESIQKVNAVSRSEGLLLTYPSIVDVTYQGQVSVKLALNV